MMKPKTLNRQPSVLSRMRRDWILYAMLAPVIVYYLLFVYRPMWGLQIAFKQYSLFKGLSASPWVGLSNFTAFFEGPYFWQLLRNTFMINLVSLAVNFPSPIILAVMFNEMKGGRLKSALQTASYLPHFISVVVVAGLVTTFLSPSSGLINILIEKLGGTRQYFLTMPEYFWGIFAGMNLWQGVGFSSIIYVAALAGVDPSLYEAATIDGAGRFKRIWHVSLPGIRNVVILKLILTLGNLLKVGYEAIILLYQPVTYETADVISTYVYRTGLVSGNYGTAAAVGLIDSVVALVLTLGANALSRKFSETSLW